MLTPQQRRLRAQVAAHTRAAKYPPEQLTAAARAAFLERFEREADPDGLLAPEERARRAEQLKRAHMLRLALASARARRARRTSGGAS